MFLVSDFTIRSLLLGAFFLEQITIAPLNCLLDAPQACRAVSIFHLFLKKCFLGNMGSSVWQLGLGLELPEHM